MSTINFEMLDRAIAKIEQDPESWDQAVYHSLCGTAHCIAGHVQILELQDLGVSEFIYQSLEQNYNRPTFTKINGEIASAAAQRILRITDYQTAKLFYAENTLGDIKRIRDRWFLESSKTEK